MALQLQDFLITGRTFEEYVAFFGLDTGALNGKKVLDCPGGVSGFVAEASRRGIDTHACDILYRFDRERIAARARESIETIYADTAWMAGFNINFYGSIEGHRKHREDALDAFAADREHERYRFETLPSLSYGDDAFDILLSSHLLFVYDDRLDADFHTDSVREMLRVAREVRLFPLVDYKNSRRDEPDNFSPMVVIIQKYFDAEVVPVDFEFQPGAGYMMIIRRSGT